MKLLSLRDHTEAFVQRTARIIEKAHISRRPRLEKEKKPPNLLTRVGTLKRFDEDYLRRGLRTSVIQTMYPNRHGGLSISLRYIIQPFRLRRF